MAKKPAKGKPIGKTKPVGKTTAPAVKPAKKGAR